MAITLQEFLKEIDLDETLAEQELPKVKEAFHSAFVNRNVADSDEEIVKKITGKRLGALQTKILRDLDIPAAEVKDKKLEEIIEFAAQKQKAKFTELEEAARTGNDEKVNKLLKDLEKEKSEKDQYKNQLTEYQKTFEQKEQELNGKLKSEKLNFHLTNIKSKVSFVDGITDITKKGFDAHINENFQFDFDDEGNFVAKDKTGKMIPNAKQSGFLSPEEVLKSEAQKAGILKMNDGKQPPKAPFKAPDGSEPKPIPGRQLPSAAIKNANRPNL